MPFWIGLWAFLYSIPKMITLVGQFFSLGRAVWNMVKEEQDRAARKALTKKFVDATHKAVNTGDTKDLEDVFKQINPS